MEIIYSKYFVKQYKKLQKGIQVKFKERLIIFISDSKNSLLNIHALQGTYKGFYSFNINSDFRVIFRYENENVAELIDIGTHSKLYK